MGDLKRRHHYVWRRYLVSWANAGRVWCRRRGAVFASDPMNLAQQRDFYKLKPLSKADVFFIRKMIEKQEDPGVRKFNLGFLERYRLASTLAFLPPPKGVDLKEFEAVQAELRHNFDEDLHGLLEQTEEPHLDDLLNGDAKGLTARRVEFMHFLAGQHMRTKRIHEGVMQRMTPSIKTLGADAESCWPVLRHAFANSIAASLTGDAAYKLVLVRNETVVPFITGDQPVVNTKVTPAARGQPPTECELFYPVSPTRAVLVSESAEWTERGLSLEQVMWLNRLMVENSHEMVFANSAEQLT